MTCDICNATLTAETAIDATVLMPVTGPATVVLCSTCLTHEVSMGNVVSHSREDAPSCDGCDRPEPLTACVIDRSECDLCATCADFFAYAVSLKPEPRQ